MLLCAQDGARVVTHIVKNASPAWKTFKTTEGTINYPGAWAVLSASDDTIAEFRSPGEDDPAVFTVTTRLLDGSTPEEFHHANGPDRYNGSTTTKVIDSSGPDAKGCYSFSYVSAVDGAPLWQRQDVVLANGKAYIMTYSGDESSYEENLYMAEAMINSFQPGGE